MALFKIQPHNQKIKPKKLDLSQRNQLILEYAPLIKYIAQRIASRLPSQVEVEDLVQAGIIGLIDAIEKFDPQLKVKFQTYAELRIKGAILDELRSLDWLPRSMREKAKRIEGAYRQLEQKLGRPASEEEIAEALKISLEELQQIFLTVKGISLINLSELEHFGNREKGEVLEFLVNPSNPEDPLTSLSLKEIEKLLAQAIERLSSKQRLVITLYYYEELTMKEIAQILGITESRVSQLHTQAILQMRGKIRKSLHP